MIFFFFFQTQPGLLLGIPKNGCSHLSLGNCQGLDTWREGWHCGVGRKKQYAWTHGVSRQFVLAEERSEANSKMEKEAEGGVWQRWECGSSGTLGHQKRTWGVEEEEGWSWSLREKCWTGTGSLILDPWCFILGRWWGSVGLGLGPWSLILNPWSLMGKCWTGTGSGERWRPAASGKPSFSWGGHLLHTLLLCNSYHNPEGGIAQPS